VHPFDAAVALTPTRENGFRGATTPAYANMVGPFGGTTGAVLLNAALLHPARLGDPVALTVNFASAVAEGEFEIEARAIRTNRSTQHWLIQLTQAGEIAATATAVFALRRDTWSAPEAIAPPDVPSADALAQAGRIAPLAWVNRYDMRFAAGDLPDRFDGEEQSDSKSAVWVRDEPPRPLDFASLAALCDTFFPRIFIRRRKRVPIGTVSLTTYFHADAAMLAAQSDRHVLGTARALNFRNGYFDQSAEVWSDAGQLLASTHQIVYFRE
jgi:acyl-coenzyme A thioesterase PaaI-like protein